LQEALVLGAQLGEGGGRLLRFARDGFVRCGAEPCDDG
jgi:hypothetical protein